MALPGEEEHADNTRVAEKQAMDHNHPLYLQASDSPGSLSIGIQLSGMENYNLWSKAMKVALLGKNKIGFIDGSVKRSTYGENLEKQWDRCNAIVLSWLMCNVRKELFSGILYKSNAHFVWKDLKERFNKVNETRSFQLHKEIVTLVQGVSSISVYYTKLRDLWDEYESVAPAPGCNCEETKDFITHCEKQKLYQFLMGLTDSYSQARSQILMTIPLPSVNQAYAMLVQDEDQRQVYGETCNEKGDPIALFTRAGVQKKKFSNKFCDHCRIKGHTRDECFKLKLCEYCGGKGHMTEFCYKRKQAEKQTSGDNQQRPRAHAALEKGESSKGSGGPSTNPSPVLTHDQYNQIMNLLNRSTIGESRANMAGTVQIPTGELAEVTHVGNCTLKGGETIKGSMYWEGEGDW